MQRSDNTRVVFFPHTIPQCTSKHLLALFSSPHLPPQLSQSPSLLPCSPLCYSSLGFPIQLCQCSIILPCRMLHFPSLQTSPEETSSVLHSRWYKKHPSVTKLPLPNLFSPNFHKNLLSNMEKQVFLPTYCTYRDSAKPYCKPSSSSPALEKWWALVIQIPFKGTTIAAENRALIPLCWLCHWRRQYARIVNARIFIKQSAVSPSSGEMKKPCLPVPLPSSSLCPLLCIQVGQVRTFGGIYFLLCTSPSQTKHYCLFFQVGFTREILKFKAHGINKHGMGMWEARCRLGRQ